MTRGDQNSPQERWGAPAATELIDSFLAKPGAYPAPQPDSGGRFSEGGTLLRLSQFNPAAL